jgi:hypothetical protein
MSDRLTCSTRSAATAAPNPLGAPRVRTADATQSATADQIRPQSTGVKRRRARDANPGVGRRVTAVKRCSVPQSDVLI